MNVVRIKCNNGTGGLFISGLLEKIAIVKVPKICINIDENFLISREEIIVIDELEGIDIEINDISEFDAAYASIHSSLSRYATVKIDNNFSVKVTPYSMFLLLPNGIEHDITSYSNYISSHELYKDSFSSVITTSSLIFKIDNVSTMSMSSSKFSELLSLRDNLLEEQVYFEPPFIELEPNMLEFVDVQIGSSEIKTYEIDILNIKKLVIESPSIEIKLSLDGITFDSQITINVPNQQEESVTTVYVRYSPLSGDIDDTIMHSAIELTGSEFVRIVGSSV